MITLPDSAQEVFDKVVTRLLKQGEKCEIPNPNIRNRENYSPTMCAYRNEDKTKSCAAGCLIPDEQYNPEFEGSVGCIS